MNRKQLTDFQKFYQYVKWYRARNGRREEEPKSLAKLVANITGQSYQRVYAGVKGQGYTNPSMADWHKLALYYGLTLDEVFQLCCAENS